MTRSWSTALAAVVLGGVAAGLILYRPDAPAAVAAPEAVPAAQPGAAEAAPELALVPADAAGFAHVRLADLWKHESMAELRKTWEAAGPKALAALKAQFLPDPTTIVRATGFVVLSPENRQPQAIGVLRFSADFDPKAVVRANMPGVKEVRAGGKTVYAEKDLAIHFPDNRTVLVGTPDGVAAYLAKPPAAEGPLAPALALARKGKPVVLAVNVAGLPIPPDALAGAGLPVDLTPLLKTRTLTLSVDLDAGTRVDLRANYATAEDAAAAEKALRAAVDLGRKELDKVRAEFEGRLEAPGKDPRPLDQLPEAVGSVFVVGALKRLDGYLADPALFTRTGADLAASVTIPKELGASYAGFAAVGVGLLLPAVQKVREAAARAQGSNNLKQIGLAIHSYHDVYGRFPEDIKDKNGKPLLSWRVAILPFIEQDNLYRQFKLDEPWDSPNNKKWSQVLIKTYLSPSATQQASPEGYGLTNYLGVAGPGAAFDPKGKLRLTDFTDGLSNTAIVVESADAVPWAKPADLPFDPKKPAPRLASVSNNDLVQVLMGDGSVRALRVSGVPEKTLKAMFTRDGGEAVDIP